MITSEEIIIVAQNVMGTMFEMTPISDEDHSEAINGQRAFTGCVQISGNWQGAVVLQGTPELARAIACRFFELSTDEVTDADQQDSIAEVTNMIGGNIKANVPAPSFLSIPSVTTGNDFNFRLPGASVISQVILNCDGHPMRIQLCEADQV